MFQNINPEFDNDNYEKKSENGKISTIIERMKNAFKIQNMIFYCLCFGISMIGFGEGVSPFGLAILAASCSNKMPIRNCISFMWGTELQ